MRLMNAQFRNITRCQADQACSIGGRNGRYGKIYPNTLEIFGSQADVQPAFLFRVAVIVQREMQANPGNTGIRQSRQVRYDLWTGNGGMPAGSKEYGLPDAHVPVPDRRNPIPA